MFLFLSSIHNGNVLEQFCHADSVSNFLLNKQCQWIGFSIVRLPGLKTTNCMVANFIKLFYFMQKIKNTKQFRCSGRLFLGSRLTEGKYKLRHSVRVVRFNYGKVMHK